MALSPVLEPPTSPFPSVLIPPAASASQKSAQIRSANLRTGPKRIFLKTRKAQLQDAHAIHQLIDSFSHDGTLLRRSYAEICANIRTFTVVETHTHQFLGCAALHIYGQHLAEIRSIVVHPDIKCVCLFTRVPGFFEHFRFRAADRLALEDKVLKDCIHCSRRNACDETAMTLGELPTSQNMPHGDFFLPEPSSALIQLQL